MFTVFVAVSSLAACSKKDKTADKVEPPKPAVIDAAPAPEAPKMFEATIEGKPYKFESAWIEGGDQHDTLVLSTRPGGCEVEKQEGDTRIRVPIPMGPGGKHHAPGPYEGELVLVNEKEKWASDGSKLSGVVTLEPAEWTKGAKVKGTLTLDDLAKADDDSLKKYTGAGPFEATVCGLTSEEYRYQATPEAADAGPVKGEGGGIKFEFKGGRAYMSHDDKRNIDRIQEIHLYASEVTCENYMSATGPEVTLYGLGGAHGPKPLLGTPQAVWSVSFKDGDKSFALDGPGWIKFDELELKHDAVIKGTIHKEASTYGVKTDPKNAGRLSGSFTAIICK
jgi:hypothetical protein